MRSALALLVALVVPYLGLLLLVAAGVVWPRAPRRRPDIGSAWPSVDLIVPARDEEATLPATLASLRRLDYPGELRIIVVDDRSRDETAAVAAAAARLDPRLSLLRVERRSRRWAPKVHAVWHGLRAGRGELVMTTDADCRVPPGWVQAMAAPFTDPRVVLVLGTVTTRGPGEAQGFRERFEAIDWLSLMLTSRSLAGFGWTFASSANAQAYRRHAFDRAGGFGLAARAPSGDEDLLAQRLGRLPGARTVFLDDPQARVLTRPMPSWGALLRQRRRWVTRYQHVEQYRPVFWLGITLLGLQSLALSLALLALPLFPAAASTVLPLWGAKLAIEIVGAHLGLARLGRGDLGGPAVVGWALLHPFYVATALLSSLLRPSSWDAGQDGYRRRLWRARWRRWQRLGRRLGQRLRRRRWQRPWRYI
jgi:cellulose synthase/poly-beta-1,6-N-acetylglucosamine synthase-like glycosyltransferase